MQWSITTAKIVLQSTLTSLASYAYCSLWAPEQGDNEKEALICQVLQLLKKNRAPLFPRRLTRSTSKLDELEKRRKRNSVKGNLPDHHEDNK